MTSVDNSTATRTLEVFNKKSQYLQELSFTRQLLAEKRTSVRISARSGEAAVINRQGPAGESIDAFALTIRLFAQDNDSISLRNMDKLYESLPIKPDIKEKFRNARGELNNYLDSNVTHIVINDTQITNRYLFEVFLYGWLAHVSEEKRRQYSGWKGNPLLFPLLEDQFVYILVQFLKTIFYIANGNREALDELAK